MICSRPRTALRRYVDLVWSTDANDVIAETGRELSLPGGSHHLVVRTGAPLRILHSAEDRIGEEVGVAILGGMRLAPVRKAMEEQANVGAVLRPDALGLLRQLTPPELAGRHIALTELWTANEVEDYIGQIRAGSTGAERLEHFERLLLRLFAGALAPDPRVCHALRRLDEGTRIDTIVSETGLSHRHFSARFQDAVGLLPVEYRQIRRFDRLITALSHRGYVGLAEIALIAGYSDQAHMAREFRAFSGLSLKEYARLAPTPSRHVPLSD